jgi:hypothetical protein
MPGLNARCWLTTALSIAKPLSMSSVPLAIPEAVLILLDFILSDP